MLSGNINITINCQKRVLHDRGAPHMVSIVVTSYPDVLVLGAVVSCMLVVLTLYPRAPQDGQLRLNWHLISPCIMIEAGLYR
jgi:hypothetical protein